MRALYFFFELPHIHKETFFYSIYGWMVKKENFVVGAEIEKLSEKGDLTKLKTYGIRYCGMI